MIVKSMAFTGYRPQKLPWGRNETADECIRFKAALSGFITDIITQGCIKFITGMALGVDTMCAKEIIRQKEEDKKIILCAAVPFAGQSDNWDDADKETYKRILTVCDQVTILSQRYTPYCMSDRNKFMVDNSDALFAVFDGKKGGTYQTLQYAAEKGKRLYIIDPLYPVVKKLEKI